MTLLPRLAPGSTSVGVDIGSNTIKVVQLQQARDGAHLSKAGSAPAPAGAVKGGVVVDAVAVAQALRSLLDTLQIDARLVTGGIAGPTVVAREVPLPAMSDRQLRKSIQWEARNYISFPVEDSIVEYEVLARPDAASGQMRVMLVAAPRDMVGSQVEVLELAGLEPAAIEIQPFAAMRGLLASDIMTDVDEETVALLGIGASYTEITIVKGGRFVLTRTIPIAGNAFTEAIKNALDVDEAEANQVKENAMQLVLSEEERATLDPAAQQASRAVEPLLDELIREVRRSLAYHDYQQQSPDASAGELGASQILLSGGSAKLPGVENYFRAQLGVPVRVVRVFTSSIPAGLNRTYLESHAPSLLVGAGLALREPLQARQKHVRAAKEAS
jgi:type IV pilus assembly protein PilM